MASLDRVAGGGYDDDRSAQVLCLGCQRFFNDLDATARAELTRAVVAASSAPRPEPITSLPEEFERSVAGGLKNRRYGHIDQTRVSYGVAAMYCQR